MRREPIMAKSSAGIGEALSGPRPAYIRPMPAHRFPPPWSVEELDACYVVRDHDGQALAISDDLAKCSLQDWSLGSPSA
jgi:hypothetical protein